MDTKNVQKVSSQALLDSLKENFFLWIHEAWKSLWFLLDTDKHTHWESETNQISLSLEEWEKTISHNRI